MNKEKYFIDLSKCSEEQQKHIFSLLPDEEDEKQYEITRVFKYLHYDEIAEYWFVDSLTSFNKTELTYSDFIKLFEGGEGEMKVDIYSGELNTERILTYKKLSEQYNIEESTVSDIFNAGAEWVNKLNSNQ